MDLAAAALARHLPALPQTAKLRQPLRVREAVKQIVRSSDESATRYVRSVLWPVPVLSFIAVLVGDLLTKALVNHELVGGRVVELPLGARLVYGENSGVAFGLLAGGGELVLFVVLVAVAGLAVLLLRSTAAVAAVPAAVLLAGAVANLIDRAGDGAVTDFIELGPWPAFNLADVAITVGVALLALTLAQRPASSARQPLPGVEPGEEPVEHGARGR